MGQNITKAVKGMVADANKEITTIPISDALNLVDSPNHIIVDLRDIRELQRTGKIPGAFSCPRGMLEFWIDPASPYHKEIFNQDKTYVFYCASAWRSALSTKLAQYKSEIIAFSTTQTKSGKKWRILNGSKYYEGG